jgi:hypothetical protein
MMFERMVLEDFGVNRARRHVVTLRDSMEEKGKSQCH